MDYKRILGILLEMTDIGKGFDFGFLRGLVRMIVRCLSYLVREKGGKRFTLFKIVLVFV